MNFPELNAPEITTDLPVKQVITLRDGSTRNAHSVTLLRLDEIKKTAIKTEVARMPNYNAKDGVSPDNVYRWLGLAQVIANHAVKSILDENMDPIAEPVNLMVLAMHPTNITTIVYFALLHVKDSYFLPTSYRCIKDSCRKSVTFNYDPRSEIEEKEVDRDYMQDVRDYMEISVAPTPYYFEYTFEEPYLVETSMKDIVDIRKIRVKWPDLKKYLSVYSDSKYKFQGDKKALYDSVTHINEMSEEETKEFKKQTGFEKFINIPKERDAEQLFKIFQKPGLSWKEYTHVCPFCSTVAEHSFNIENFFSFLSR